MSGGHTWITLYWYPRHPGFLWGMGRVLQSPRSDLFRMPALKHEAELEEV